MRVHEMHASVKNISRGEGKSCVQQGAYILRTRMVDEHTGEVWDYSTRGGLAYSGVAVQEDGQAPEWAYEPRELLNAIEKNEKRKDSRVGRMMTVAHPSEFDERARREADLKIAHEIIRRYGGAAIYAAHVPEADKKRDKNLPLNHHTHFQWTPRKFENQRFAAKKDCRLDHIRHGPLEMEELRAAIAAIHNDIAVREGLPCYTEHLSYEKRGIDKEATQHMGAWATRLERKGKGSAIGQKNREIAARNADRKQNVIYIEEARARLSRRQDEAPERGGPQASVEDAQEERYQAFYRETYERRASMLGAIEKEHGREEKELQREAARLTGSIEHAGFLTGVWRRITGRARREKEELDRIKARLVDIGRYRDAQHAQFERERLERLETLKEAQEAALEAPALPLRAVGGSGLRPEAQKQPTAPEMRAGDAVKEQAKEQPGPGDYEKRRRAYFRKMGARNKREREKDEERGKSPAPDFNDARKPQPPEPAKEFDQAASPPSVPPEPSNDEARRAKFMSRRQKRDHAPEWDGPSR